MAGKEQKRFVVTFARGFGSGGKEIASKLAKVLGIHCYENRILTLASQMTGLDEELFREVDEKVRNKGGISSFLRGLPKAKSYIARNEKFVSDDKLFEYHPSTQSHHLLFQQIALRTCDRLSLIRFPIHMREFSVSEIYHYRSLQKSIHKLVFEVALAF